MDIFSVPFLVFLVSSFVLFYLVYLLNKAAKKTIVPQWLVLLASSLLFYGFTNYFYLIYLGISFVVSYCAAILCQYKLFKKTNNPDVAEYELNPSVVDSHAKRKKYENIVLTISILINVGILATLKYFDFAVGTVNSLFGTSFAFKHFILPIGISFYTFSLIAYNVDCLKRSTKAEKNPFKFLLFVSYFPKIMNGPISSYDRLKEDGLFSEHNFLDNDYLKSFFRISIGLIKKLVIANTLNVYVNATYSNLQNSYGGGLLLISILYTIQLYCDFSGFIDISLGVSGLFGIKLEENFDVPYISQSIGEFWRRWHITLGAWLKKYIYIPLGGNRVPLWRWIINTLIVWLVSGIWHGANWTFIVWGLFHGVLLVAEGLPKQIRKRKGDNSPPKEKGICLKILCIVGTFALVNLGWIFFRSESLSQSGTFIWHMIQIWKSGYNVFADTSINNANWFFIIAMVFVALLIGLKILLKYKDNISNKFSKPELIGMISKYSVTVVFVSISIFAFFYLKSVGGGESSFIYFNF